MNYPTNQFELLKKGLKILSVHINVKNVNPSQLQYLLYQQASEGQKHNSLFINDKGEIKRQYSIKDKTDFLPLINFLNEENFPLYPQNCNDSHIETAVKKALKEI